VPIYEYACKKCDHVLDALQKMNDEPLVDCPACGEPELKKLLSAPRFRLKGKGWYETDFKKDNQRNVLKSDTEPAKGDKSESKPAKTDTAKTDTKKTEKKPDSKTKAKSES
jgi:putative FmdB family regulatory protein